MNNATQLTSADLQKVFPPLRVNCVTMQYGLLDVRNRLPAPLRSVSLADLCDLLEAQDWVQVERIAGRRFFSRKK